MNHSSKETSKQYILISAMDIDSPEKVNEHLDEQGSIFAVVAKFQRGDKPSWIEKKI